MEKANLLIIQGENDADYILKTPDLYWFVFNRADNISRFAYINRLNLHPNTIKHVLQRWNS